MEKEIKVIGITGHPGSGKDTIADYFLSRGYVKTGGGDIIRKIMVERGLPTDRTHMYDFVAEQRRLYGNDYLSRETIKAITGNTVVTGFRNREEIVVFRDHFGDNFFLIAVDAPIEMRYERARMRMRTSDKISFEQFKAEEDRERASSSGSHEVDHVMGMARVLIMNDGSRDELIEKIHFAIPSSFLENKE
jgi:dephospho-CoA kinase